MRCDCGFDFATSKIKASYANSDTIAKARERAEKNLPTVVARVSVFTIVYFAAAFGMYFVLGIKPGGVLLGIAFGLAGAAAATIRINVKRWF